MGDMPSLLVSEFETEEQAVSYDAWFRAKVQRSLEAPGAVIPHDEVNVRMEGIIEEVKIKQS